MRITHYDENLVAPINEIERFLRERRWILRKRVMADQVVNTKPLKDYVIPTEEEPHCSIVPPLILENNFKLKLSLIGMVQQNQFTGLPSEKPKLHLSIFIDNCGTVKANDIDQNVIHLRLFPFSFIDCVRPFPS